MPQYGRYLRIGWTVLCATMAVLIVILWVWSYRRPVALPKVSRHALVATKGKLEIDRGIVRTNRRIFDSVNFQLDDGTQRFGVPGPAEMMATGFVVPFATVLMFPICGIIASWIVRKQFSLRTLLVAMTLVAVVLAVTVATVKR
jgi:hypothetical protein